MTPSELFRTDRAEYERQTEALFDAAAASNAPASWSNGKPCVLRMGAEIMADDSIAEEKIEVTDDYQIGAVAIIEKPLPSNFVHDAGVFAGKLTPREWRIKGIQPLGAELCMVYGDSGSGKSFLINDMFAAVHLGVDWNGKKTMQGRVIYLCAEGANDHKYRLHAQAREYGVLVSDLPGVIDNAPDLSTGDAWEKVATQITEAGGCDVLIIDTLSATNTKDENSPEMVAYIRNVKKIQRTVGCTVWCVHHSGKDASRGARGHSSLRASVDVELEVTRDGDARSAKLTKSKGGADGFEFAFALRFVPLGKDSEGDVYGSCAVDYTDDAPVHAKKQPKHGTKADAALKAVKALIVAKRGPVDVDEARTAVIGTMSPPEDGQRDRRSSRAGEQIDALCRQELLFRDGRQIRDCEGKAIEATAGSDPFE